eukprot:9490349-Pyramimonas_sp.AAC.1
MSVTISGSSQHDSGRRHNNSLLAVMNWLIWLVGDNMHSNESPFSLLHPADEENELEIAPLLQASLVAGVQNVLPLRGAVSKQNPPKPPHPRLQHLHVSEVTPPSTPSHCHAPSHHQPKFYLESDGSPRE